METLIVRHFKRWCREHLPTGAKTSAQDAADFFCAPAGIRLQQALRAHLGPSPREDWGTVHKTLTAKGLI